MDDVYEIRTAPPLVRTVGGWSNSDIEYRVVVLGAGPRVPFVQQSGLTSSGCGSDGTRLDAGRAAGARCGRVRPCVRTRALPPLFVCPTVGCRRPSVQWVKINRRSSVYSPPPSVPPASNDRWCCAAPVKFPRTWRTYQSAEAVERHGGSRRPEGGGALPCLAPSRKILDLPRSTDTSKPSPLGFIGRRCN